MIGCEILSKFDPRRSKNIFELRDLTLNNLDADLMLPIPFLTLYLTSYLSHPKDQHFLSGSIMKSRSGSIVELSRWFLDMISQHNFFSDQNTKFPKILRIEISDGSGGFLSSQNIWMTEVWGRMLFMNLYPRIDPSGGRLSQQHPTPYPGQKFPLIYI